MSEKISDLLSEGRLCDWLGLEVPELGKRNRKVTNWIKLGLPCIEISEMRFFFGNDVVSFMETRRGQRAKHH